MEENPMPAGRSDGREPQRLEQFFSAPTTKVGFLLLALYVGYRKLVKGGRKLF